MNSEPHAPQRYSPLELAQAFMETGELEDALAALDTQLTAHQDDSEARRMRAEVRARQGTDDSLRGALDDYAHLQTLAPLTADDAVRCSALYERLGDLHSALNVIESVRQQFPQNARLTERHVHLLHAGGQDTAALAVIMALPADEINTWRWQQWVGDLSAQMGDGAQAVEAYSKALDLLTAHSAGMDERWALPLRARLLLARSAVNRTRGEYAAAETDAAAAGTLIPDDPAVPFNRGLIAALNGDMTTAKALVGQALEAAPDVMREAFMRELDADTRFAALT